MNADDIDVNAFGAPDREAWRKLVDKALKGADFQQTLVSASDDGIAIQPLYQRQSDAAIIHRRRPEQPWIVAQRMDDPDIERAFAQLDDDLCNGATGIHLILRNGPASYGVGLDLPSDGRAFAGRLATALSVRSVSCRLDGASPALARSLAEAMSGSAATVHFGLGAHAAADEEELAAELLSGLSGDEASSTVLNAGGRAVHNAGGTEAQELAVMAAGLAQHLRRMDKAGVALETVLGATSLCLAADQDQFLTIAKARAARLVFARMADACGVSLALPAHLFMETSYRTLTRLDPETNLLRNTIAVFAAGTGGADEISVLPHTLAHGVPDPLARRLARNMQTILIAESHLDHVSDPAAGAGGIETLTDALAEKAWAIFSEIERDGGLDAVIASGRLAAMVAQARATRPARAIVGTTLFPNKTERPVSVLGPLGEIGTWMELRPVRLDEAERA
jgi:methylmalonyl-CoA mutase